MTQHPKEGDRVTIGEVIVLKIVTESSGLLVREWELVTVVCQLLNQSNLVFQVILDSSDTLRRSVKESCLIPIDELHVWNW